MTRPERQFLLSIEVKIVLIMAKRQHQNPFESNEPTSSHELVGCVIPFRLLFNFFTFYLSFFFVSFDRSSRNDQKCLIESSAKCQGKANTARKRKLGIEKKKRKEKGEIPT